MEAGAETRAILDALHATRASGAPGWLAGWLPEPAGVALGGRGQRIEGHVCVCVACCVLAGTEEH